jgi:hypothetical protein
MLPHCEHPAETAAVAVLQVIIASTQETLRALLVRLNCCVGQAVHAATIGTTWPLFWQGRSLLPVLRYFAVVALSHQYGARMCFQGT